MKPTINVLFRKDGYRIGHEEDRVELFLQLEKLVAGDAVNRAVAKKLMRVIPDAEWIFIDLDEARKSDTKFLYYTLKEGTEGGIAVFPENEKIWNLLKEICVIW